MHVIDIRICCFNKNLVCSDASKGMVLSAAVEDLRLVKHPVVYNELAQSIYIIHFATLQPALAISKSRTHGTFQVFTILHFHKISSLLSDVSAECPCAHVPRTPTYESEHARSSWFPLFMGWH